MVTDGSTDETVARLEHEFALESFPRVYVPGIATAPAIAVTLTCPLAPANTGGSISYSGTVRNSGNVTLTNIFVVNNQPAAGTAVSLSGIDSPYDIGAAARPQVGISRTPQVLDNVTWTKGSDVSALIGQPVRLRFVMQEADLYALRFAPVK